MTVKVCVVYHSGYGHTAKQAEAGADELSSEEAEKVEAFVDELLDVLVVIGRLLGLDEGAMQAEFLDGPLHTLVGVLVKGAVVDLAHVGDQTRMEVL